MHLSNYYPKYAYLQYILTFFRFVSLKSKIVFLFKQVRNSNSRKTRLKNVFVALNSNMLGTLVGLNLKKCKVKESFFNEP